MEILVALIFLIPYIIGLVLGLRMGYKWGKEDTWDEVKAILERKHRHDV